MINERIKSIKDDITLGVLSTEQIFQRHVVDSRTYFFQDYLENPSEEYEAKSLIAEALGVHIHEVLFVGSSKLGFSLRPNNRFKHFDARYKKTNIRRDRSDLDVAVISPTLFNRLAEASYEFTNSFQSRWETNEYYKTAEDVPGDVPLCYRYYEYITKGWFRPDFRPPSYEFCINGHQFEAVKSYFYKKYRRKLGLGIYNTWHFFKMYHINNLTELSFAVKSEVL